MAMSKVVKSRCVAVKCEGCFTEWYSPHFKDPYESNARVRAYCDKRNADPVVGPSLGDSVTDYLCGDLHYLGERLCWGAANWDAAVKGFKAVVRMCIADGKTRTYAVNGIKDIKITPFTKEKLPPLNEKSLEYYGKYKELVKARVAAI